MAITHPTLVRNAVADTVCGKADLGTTIAKPLLQFSPVSNFSSVAATLVMATSTATAFQPAVGGTATANPIADDPAAVGAATPCQWFRVLDRDNNEVFRGTVSDLNGTGDVRLPNPLIAPLDQVTAPVVSYSAPP